MSVKEQIEAVNKSLGEMLKPEQIQLVMGFIGGLVEGGVASGAPKPGDRAPDFTLPNAAGEQVSLHDVLARGPAVVAFYRGIWCPYCNVALRSLQEALPEIKALGADLVMISPQTPDSSLTTKEKFELKFEVLSDAGNKVAKDYGLVFTITGEVQTLYHDLDIPLPRFNGDESWELPTPGTFVLDRDGRITWSFVDANYVNRAEPADILEALRTMAKAA